METKNEIWKDIEGYEGRYQVSNLGRIKALSRIIDIYFKNGSVQHRRIKERIIKPWRDSLCKYMMIGLHANGQKENHLVHRLVAKAFIPNPNNLPEVNHKNEVKVDNRVQNLEWCDRIYNAYYGDNSRTKKIIQMDLQGNVIKTFNGIREAELVTGIQHESISAVCRGEPSHKTAGGYRWQYLTDGD
jgi:hypothetical protein